jgi:hypothetical protein
MSEREDGNYESPAKSCLFTPEEEETITDILDVREYEVEQPHVAIDQASHRTLQSLLTPRSIEIQLVGLQSVQLNSIQSGISTILRVLDILRTRILASIAVTFYMSTGCF